MRFRPAPLAILVLGASALAFAAGSLRSDPVPPPEVDLVALSDAIADLAERVADATVTIEVRHHEGEQLVAGEGSGFVVDAFRGLVVTNQHVVREEPRATVVLHDGRRFEGKVLGTDPKSDLAVLRIPAGAARRQLAWGDSDDLRPGDLVMAVGSPLNLEGTTSLGVVSALHRRLRQGEDAYEDFIQFDAFIDRGSSGGPLVDMQGRVVGINTAIGATEGAPSWSGIGYAVPSALARRFTADLAEHGYVRRGRLGVKVESVSADTARLLGLERPYGATIVEIVPDGPADRAGLELRDVILAIDGVEVTDATQVRARIGAVEPGQRVRLKVLSRREIREVPVVVGEAPRE